MEEKAITLCRSEPASHLPISTQNTRTYNSLTEGQCTGNPQVDAPYESNTRGQTWDVGEIPGARELCGANRTSDLFTERVQVPHVICEENFHESSEGAATSAKNICTSSWTSCDILASVSPKCLSVSWCLLASSELAVFLLGANFRNTRTPRDTLRIYPDYIGLTRFPIITF